MRWTLIEAVAREATGRPTATLAAVEMKMKQYDGFDGVHMRIADTVPLLRGKNKGRPNWRTKTNEQEWTMPRDEFYAAVAAWGARTGLCVECAGEGNELVRASVAEGSVFRDCRKCEGSGKAGVSL